MQFQKLLAVVFVAGLAGAGSLKAQNADNSAQARAREALRQKLAELNGQPAPPTNSVAQPMAPAPVAVAPPVTAPPAVVVTPAPSPAVMDNAAPVSGSSGRLSPEERQKVIEAMRQRMAELSGQPAGATPAPAIAPVAAAPQTVETVAPAPAIVATTPPPMQAGSHLSPEDEARVLAAVRGTKAQLDAKDPSVAAGATGMASDKMMTPPRTVQVIGGASGSSSAMASVMLAGSKQQRLAELLQLYKADKITPLEYHEQRAKIVTEPDTDH